MAGERQRYALVSTSKVPEFEHIGYVDNFVTICFRVKDCVRHVAWRRGPTSSHGSNIELYSEGTEVFERKEFFYEFPKACFLSVDMATTVMESCILHWKELHRIEARPAMRLHLARCMAGDLYKLAMEAEKLGKVRFEMNAEISIFSALYLNF